MSTIHIRPFSSTPRALLVVLLLLTFTWSQHEMQRHAVLHVADHLSQHHEQGLQNPTGELSCIECSLLAGAAHAVPGGAASLPADIINSSPIAWNFVPRTVSPDSYYSNRAPPVLL